LGITDKGVSNPATDMLLICFCTIIICIYNNAKIVYNYKYYNKRPNKKMTCGALCFRYFFIGNIS
jgi:hypothetical protein